MIFFQVKIKGEVKTIRDTDKWQGVDLFGNIDEADQNGSDIENMLFKLAQLMADPINPIMYIIPENNELNKIWLRI